MFVATLDGIFKYPDIPEEYEPYVQFKATIEKREVKDGDDLAILSISGTDSHHVLFLDSYNNIREIEKELRGLGIQPDFIVCRSEHHIEKELKDADAKINHTTLKIIGGHL